MEAIVLNERIEIFRNTFDLCSYTSCPLLPGQPAEITMAGPRDEGNIDLLGKYAVRVEIATQSMEDASWVLITCVEEILNL